MEEALSGIMDPVYQKMFGIDANAKVDMKDVMYQGLIGFVSGGVLSGASLGINNAQSYRVGSRMTVESTNSLMNKAKDIAEYGNKYYESIKNEPNASKLADNFNQHIKAATATYNTLREYTAKRDTRISEKAGKARDTDRLQAKYKNIEDTKVYYMLKGELARSIASIEMTKGVIHTKANILAHIEDYKEVLGLSEITDDKLNELAIQAYVTKSLIPQEAYEKLIAQGRVLGGDGQLANYISNLSDEKVNSLNELLGVDLKEDSIDLIKDRIFELGNKGQPNIIEFVDLLKILKNENGRLGLKGTVLVNGMVTDKVALPDGKVTLKKGEAKLFILPHNKGLLAVARGESGKYAIALDSNNNGIIDFDKVIENLTQVKFNELLERARANKTVEAKAKEKTKVEVSNKKEDLNLSTWRQLPYEDKLKSSYAFNLNYLSKKVNSLIVDKLNGDSREYKENRIIPIEFDAFVDSKNKGILEKYEVRPNDYIIVTLDKIADKINKLKNIGIQDKPMLMKVNKLFDVMSEIGDKSKNTHGLDTEIKQIPKLLAKPRYMLKGQSAKKFEFVLKLKDKNGDPVNVVIEINDSKQFQGDAYECNVLVSAYGKKNIGNYIKRMETEGRVLYDKSKIEKEYSLVKEIQLSDQQQEFFKQSKVRNEKGDLLRVYHGTNGDFFTFDVGKIGANGGQYGPGYYFTTKQNTAAGYGPKTIDAYLNIKKPFIIKEGKLKNGLNDFLYFNLTSQQSEKLLRLHPEIKSLEDSPLGNYSEAFWEEGPTRRVVSEVASQLTVLGYFLENSV